VNVLRVNINISEELCKQVDERAKSMFLSRSAYISTALAQKMQADDAMRMLPEMAKTMQDAMEMMKQGKNPSNAIKAAESRKKGVEA
jgi:metal-responsive CopG/Arc/MetJ family transcriptional regulator